MNTKDPEQKQKTASPKKTAAHKESGAAKQKQSKAAAQKSQRKAADSKAKTKPTAGPKTTATAGARSVKKQRPDSSGGRAETGGGKDASATIEGRPVRAGTPGAGTPGARTPGVGTPQKLAARLDSHQVLATARLLRVSPQKLNLVAASMRGKKAETVLAELQFSKKRIARDVIKLLNSAIANAENNRQLDLDRLYVKESWVGKSLLMKRFRARARGRAARIVKPFSRMTIVLEEQQSEL